MRVTLNGIVAADEDVEIYAWFGWQAFGPAMVRQAIADCPDGEELVLEINSGGGSVMAGNEIYSVLKSVQGHTTRAEIQSLAASAASYLALGCDSVHMSPVAQMMIHLPSTVTAGDRGEHLASVHMLDTVRESILNAYELKAGGKTERAELRRMMNATTWMTAQEAVEKGLADSILYQDEPQPANIMNAMGGLPDITQLRDEFRRQTKTEPAPKHGADNSESWQATARLTLEKNRFMEVTK